MEIWNEVFSNLWYISILAVILACLIVANIIAGLYYTIGSGTMIFDWKKLLNGVLKGVVVLAASYLITVALTAIPYVIAATGINIDDASVNAVSVAILFLIWGWAIIKYALAALENIRKIFGVTTTINKKE